MDAGQILERFGFPTLLVFLACIALYKVARWFASNIADPLIKSHVGIVTTVQTNNTIATKTLENQQELLEKIEGLQQEQLDILRKVEEHIIRKQ